MDGENNFPPPSSTQVLLVPLAGILLILMIFFVACVVVFFCVRKILQNRGLDTEMWPVCRCSVGTNYCSSLCLNIAEKLDCNTPDTKVWLDNVCPSQQQCSIFWGKLSSCYCCYSIANICKDMQLCPNTSSPGFTCPTCSCPCNCECECTIPQCQEINCICFKIKV